MDDCFRVADEVFVPLSRKKREDILKRRVSHSISNCIADPVDATLSSTHDGEID